VSAFTALSATGFYLILLSFALPATRGYSQKLFSQPGQATQRHLMGFDAIRGGAALLVVLGHCIYFAYPAFTDLPKGLVLIANQASKAVPIFCVLSGFLIYRAVLAIKTLPDVRSYCIRRFFRVYPAYALGVVVAAILHQYDVSNLSPDTSASARFFADLFMTRVLWWPGFANPVAWSLYHEILFYALLPLIVLTIGQHRMALFSILCVAGLLLADYPSRDFGLYKYFAFGILASIYSERLKPYALFALLAGGALVAVEFAGLDVVFKLGLTPAKAPYGGGFGLGLGTALALAGLPHLSLLGKALDVFPLRMLGAISYSLFIIHPFVLNVVFPETGSLVGPRDYSRFALHGTIGPAKLFLVLIPTILFWSALCFVIVERPGIRLGVSLLSRNRPKVPDAIAAEPAKT